jgi:hypothetical protein
MITSGRNVSAAISIRLSLSATPPSLDLPRAASRDARMSGGALTRTATAWR